MTLTRYLANLSQITTVNRGRVRKFIAAFGAVYGLILGHTINFRETRKTIFDFKHR